MCMYVLYRYVYVCACLIQAIEQALLLPLLLCRLELCVYVCIGICTYIYRLLRQGTPVLWHTEHLTQQKTSPKKKKAETNTKNSTANTPGAVDRQRAVRPKKQI